MRDLKISWYFLFIVAFLLAACEPYLLAPNGARPIKKLDKDYYSTNKVYLHCQAATIKFAKENEINGCRRVSSMEAYLFNRSEGGEASLSLDCYDTGVRRSVSSAIRLRGEPPRVSVCEFKDGKANLVGIYEGHYVQSEDKCADYIREHLSRDRYPYNDVVGLKYHVSQKNLTEQDLYVIEGALRWRIREEPGSYFMVGKKIERFRCVVDNGVVQEVTFSELGDLNPGESSRLQLHHFF